MKINKVIVLYIGLVIMSLIITYYRIENISLYNKIKSISTDLQMTLFYNSRIIGACISDAKLYSLNNGNDSYLDIKDGMVLYSTNKGCKKCNELAFKLLNRFISRKNLYSIINNYSIMEFNPFRDFILKYKTIIWDKYNSIDKLLGLDTRKMEPLLLIIRHGIIIQYQFINELNFNNVEDILNKAS